MRSLSRKTIGATLALAVLSSALAASSPASAHQWRDGFHRGSWGPGLAIGVIGLAAGAIIASQYDCTARHTARP